MAQRRVRARSEVVTGSGATCRSAIATTFRPTWRVELRPVTRVTRPALVPELYVSNIARSLEFYLDILGFEIWYERPEEKFASVRLGDAHLMLEEAPSLNRATRSDFENGQWRTGDLERPFGRGVNLEIEVEDVEAAHARILENGIDILLPLHEKTYRIDADQRTVRRLLVADPDGYLIRLSQTMNGGRL